MAVVQKMALGMGLGLMAAGVGVFIGGNRGLLAGAAVGGVAMVCVNGDVKPLSDILSSKKKDELLDLIISLTRIGFEFWMMEDADNIQLNMDKQSRLILDQFLKLIRG